MRQKGFTLIELALIITLLGIMVVLYIEAAGDLSNIAIDGVSRKAQQDIRYAQVLAQTSGVRHGAKFTANGTYEVYRNVPGNFVRDPVTGLSLVEDLEKYPGVAISTDYQAEFDGYGVPTMGYDRRVRFVADSGAIRDVYVVDKTGAVVVDLIQAGTGCSCTLCKQ